MIVSDYYQNYKGPNLTKATLNNENITQQIIEFYGENNGTPESLSFGSIELLSKFISMPFL